MTMANRLKSVLVVFVISSSLLYAQDDTPIKVEGTIKDAETNEPVKARIYYESLPYGNKVGVINDSTFSFNIEKDKQYAISAKADGYSIANTTVNPDSANNGVITQNIVLEQNSIGRVMRLETLIFSRGNSKIPSSAYPELDNLAQAMRESPSMVIQLEGHTDYRGDAKKNMKLSEDRVESTKAYLVNHRIDKKRILVQAFGGTRPIKRSNDPESYKLNRRVEVRVVQN